MKTAAILSVMFLLIGVATARAADPFVHLEWALKNDGQRIPVSIDDLHTRQMAGKPGTDIDLQGLGRSTLKAKLKKIPIVAVLDTGIDLKHEDLQASIMKGGRDYTTDNVVLQKFPQDKDGHGTHVAGTIAAVADNGIGVQGVSDLIRILPLKVFSNQSSTSVPFGERLARAIRYAISKNVDVINMSLGDPIFNASEDLKAALHEAYEKGIILVAASGNFGHGITPFPCSAREVICVGAVNASGRVAPFSNMSGQVDLLAPGDNILSTYPRSLTPKQFSEAGYSYLSGTSQAAPFVSAAAAILKGVFPRISQDEVRARLYESALPRPGRIDSLAGLIQIASAIQLDPRPSVRPVFKELRDLKVDKSRRFAFRLPIKNYWSRASSVIVDIRAEQKGIVLDTTHFDLGSMAQDESRDLAIQGAVQHLGTEARVRFVVTITLDGKRESYAHLFNFYRHTGPHLEGVTTLSFPTSVPDRIIFKRDNGILQPVLMSIEPLKRGEGEPEYFTTRTSANGFELFVYLERNGQYVEKRMFLPNCKQIFSIRRLDLDQNGQDDYLVRYLGTEGKSPFKTEHYLYLNSEFQPLYRQGSEFSFTTYEGITLLDELMQFVPVRYGHRTMQIPVFVQTGFVPKEDANPNPMEVDPLSLNHPTGELGQQVYYLKPDDKQHTFTLRVLDNAQFYLNTYRSLHLTWSDRLGVLFPLQKRTPSRAYFLYSAGTSANTSFWVLEVSANLETSLHPVPAPIDLSQAQFKSMISLKGKKANYEAGSLLGWFQSTYEVYLATLNDTSPIHPELLKLTPDGDPLTHILSGFLDTNGPEYFFFTTRDLLAVRTGSANQKMNRYSLFKVQYVSDADYASLYKPVVVSSPSNKKPGFFIDSTYFDLSTAYVVEDDSVEGLHAPIRYNLSLPKSCSFVDPTNSKGEDQITFLCREGDKITLNFIKLDN